MSVSTALVQKLTSGAGRRFGYLGVSVFWQPMTAMPVSKHLWRGCHASTECSAQAKELLGHGVLQQSPTGDGVGP